MHCTELHFKWLKLSVLLLSKCCPFWKSSCQHEKAAWRSAPCGSDCQKTIVRGRGTLSQAFPWRGRCPVRTLGGWGGNPAFLMKVPASFLFLLATSSVGCAASFPSRGSLWPAVSISATREPDFLTSWKKSRIPPGLFYLIFCVLRIAKV